MSTPKVLEEYPIPFESYRQIYGSMVDEILNGGAESLSDEQLRIAWRYIGLRAGMRVINYYGDLSHPLSRKARRMSTRVCIEAQEEMRRRGISIRGPLT